MAAVRTTRAPIHLDCVGGRVKRAVRGTRRYLGPAEMVDAQGRIWTIDGVAEPVQGVCPFCGRTVLPARTWEGCMATLDEIVAPDRRRPGLTRLERLERDRDIRALARDGRTRAELAERYSLSETRIGQILARPGHEDEP